MSISTKDRTENLLEALRIMLTIIGEGRLDATLFEPEDARFQDVLPTTWEALEESGFVQQMSSSAGNASESRYARSLPN